MSAGLTEEQRRRIEENKRKALAKREEKLGKVQIHTVSRQNGGSLSYQTAVSGTNKTAVTLQRHFPDTHQGTSIMQSETSSGSRSHTANASAISSSDPSVSERIEANRLKALAKRAEKLGQSPPKSSGQNCSVSVRNVSNSAMSNHSLTSGTGSMYNKTLIKNINTLSGAAVSHCQSSSVVKSLACPDKPFVEPQSKGGNVSGQVTPAVPREPTQAAGGRNLFGFVGHGTVKGSCILVSRERFEVSVSYSAPLLEVFKCMKTKQYDAVTKKWSFKLEEYNQLMTMIKPLMPNVQIEPLPKAVHQVFSAQFKGVYPHKDVPIADLSKVEPSLVNSLMAFQREGVNFGVHKNGRVLIADDMGLGKTIQAICLACYYRSEWPLLIVVPSSVRFDWAQQFKRWVPSLDPKEVHVAVTGKDSCSAGLINILSYDLMARKADELKNIHFQIIVMDECHLLKNYKTSRCRAAMPILQNARRVILLSGTPALSRPLELYTQISAICPFLLKYQEFGVRYCDGKQMPWGWDFSGSSNMSELQLILEEKIMIRRLKKDVLTELPDKVRQMVLLDPSSIKVNKDLKRASKVLNTANLKGMEQRGALLDYFHESARAKMEAIREYIRDLLEGDKKFLVFAHHQEVLDSVEDLVKTRTASSTQYIRIDGRTSSEQRNLFCQKFQNNDNVRVAILSITAANAGINLSTANLVVFAELFWNPGILVQAEDRAHRLGQKDSVSVHYLVAQSTSDDHIWPMIQKKLEVLGRAGLTKDDFSSADTTTVKDRRQQEILQFLEESFTEEVFPMDDLSDIEFSSKDRKTKSEAGKQVSITKFLSPTKELPAPLHTPTKEKKPRGLFKYFSPDKKGQAPDVGHSGERSRTPEVPESSDQKVDTGIKDIDVLLSDEMDEWDVDNEPVAKKCRT